MNAWERAAALVRREARELLQVNPTDRPWQLPVAAAIATGAPLFLAAATGELGAGLVGSLGGMVFLYVRDTPMHHRMVVLMACAFGMIASYCAGLLSHPHPALILPAVTAVAMLSTMVCRYYDMPPPASLLFVMAAAIGAYAPIERSHFFATLGMFAMATLFAVFVGFVYSLALLRQRPPQPVKPLPPATFERVVFDAVVIGGFVGLALLLGQLLGLDRPYWVPISCLAVIQGASLRAVWNRNLQRMVGTVVGLALTWGLLSLPLDAWRTAAVMTLLTVAIEWLVVRHYAVAAMFITPLALLLVEAGQLGAAPPGPLMQARLVDTVLGCVVGLVGGWCIHSLGFRAWLGEPMRRLVPARMRRGGGRG